MGQRWPACDPAIREWILEVVAKLGDELGNNLVGVYLHGSLATGSFYSPKSDVDLLFVCDRTLSVDARRRFARAAVTVSRDRPLIGGLECSVIRRDVAGAAVHPMPFEVHVSEEWVQGIENDTVDHRMERTDPDLVAHCQVVMESGLCLRGVLVEDVFGPVRQEDFLDAVTGDLEWIIENEHILESLCTPC